MYERDYSNKEGRRVTIAHKSEDGTRFQTVSEHLHGTASLSSKFADAFGAKDQGELAGLLHDIGKYSDAFQKRILNDGPIVDHSTAGAQEANKLNQVPVAFAVAGHHSGLPDGGHPQDISGTPTLFGRLRKNVEPFNTWSDEIKLPATNPPSWAIQDNITVDFYTRMLYSCLVDADFLDTESFMSDEKSPRGSGDTLETLAEIVQKKAESFLQNENLSPVIEARNDVLRACIDHGKNGSQGLYTLTVPTGGGKTFSSLAFAMEHALKHHMQRIIYVIPYTSIIDQTVSAFKDILGEENVLAHYSSAEYKQKDQEDLSAQDYRALLASENWDMPVIVTTAVQFFESIYANRSSRCRKLHNIANSVVIFDEAQTLPCDYLYPCVSAISQLVQHYHTTAVLCTATQPELMPIFQDLKSGLTATEIIPNTDSLYNALKRVQLFDAGDLTYENLGQLLEELSQVLCIVNRRQTAQDLYKSLPSDGCFCLTTLLCPADRKKQLDSIRDRLKAGLPCRVVSTSLIEAGVDVDFPTVYREECGLDSLLQAAGRCNREGRRAADDSYVYRFILSDTSSLKMISQNISALHFTARHCDELNSLEAVSCYFNELLTNIKSKASMDQKNILDYIENGISGCAFPFAQIAEKFHLIETPTRTVYIPIGEGKNLCDEIQNGNLNRSILRKLGSYSVSCYPEHFKKLSEAGALELLPTGDAILIDSSQYNENTGLAMEPESGRGIFI